MWKKCILLICVGWCAQTATCNSLQEVALARAIQQSPSNFLKHFGYMRFYLPSNRMITRASFLERFLKSNIQKEHQYALALYLFNMYIITNNYKQGASGEITLNELGVLDGFMRCAEPFDFKNAFQFYQKNREEVNARIGRIPWKVLGWQPPTQQEYDRWVKLLETQPLRRSQAVYKWPAFNLLRAEVPPAMSAPLVPFLESALQQGRQQVVFYDKPAATVADLDSHIGIKQVRRERTYRWVAEECNYSSYLLAKILTAAVVKNSRMWARVRIYTLTAFPAQGEFLTPAYGDRFKLANGQKSLAWQYHTAVLVVVPHNGAYVAVVLDTFLGGLEPMALNDWLTHFSINNTVFTAEPFRRSKEVENALRVPEQINGSTVWVNGKAYTPAKVIE